MVMKAIQGRPCRARLTRIPSRRLIKVLLASLNLTQSDIARELGISPQYVSMIVSGRKRLLPDNPILAHFAELLGQQVDALFPLVDLEAIAEESAPLIL